MVVLDTTYGCTTYTVYKYMYEPTHRKATNSLQNIIACMRGTMNSTPSDFMLKGHETFNLTPVK